MRRKGSAAIVPLFLAITLLFWVAWFLGGENDILHEINNRTYLNQLQVKFAIPAIQKKYELKDSHANWNDQVNTYIDTQMKNNIDR